VVPFADLGSGIKYMVASFFTGSAADPVLVHTSGRLAPNTTSYRSDQQAGLLVGNSTLRTNMLLWARIVAEDYAGLTASNTTAVTTFVAQELEGEWSTNATYARVWPV
jgi:hypothetical protein